MTHDRRFARAELVSFTAALLLTASAAAPSDTAPVTPPAEPGTAAGTAAAPDASGACYPIDRDHVACYDRPRLSDFVLSSPGTIGSWLKDSFRGENALWIAGIVASTSGLVAFDQDLIHGAQDVGRWAHVGEGRMGTVPVVPIPYPTDAGSALYYIGDGMVPVVLTAAMLGWGLATSDTRVLQTTAHLTTGLLSVGIVCQTVKHLTGRESPSRATQPGGRWRPLPDQSDYFANVPAYDAFPSGHMATAMVTVTILAEDYPEYRLIRPIGYGLMTLLGFQMMNNDVHWASDYPLAIAIGYGLGKSAVARGRRVLAAAEDAARQEPRTDVTLVPFPVRDGGGLALLGTF